MKPNSERIPSLVIVLGIVSLFTDAATEMIYPLIPLYISALGSGAIILGLIEGTAETTASLLKLASGILSDKIGRRRLFVLTGYTISSLIRPVTGLVSSAWEIILVRMFDRVGKGIRTAPGMPLSPHRQPDHPGERHLDLKGPWTIQGLWPGL